MALKNVTVWVGGQAWKVAQARSLKDAHHAIAMARCTGSIGSNHYERSGGQDTVIALVEKVQLNACKA